MTFLTDEYRKDLREKIERYLEQAINKADGLPIDYRISLDYNKENGGISSCEENTGEDGHNSNWINIATVDAWDSVDNSNETTCQNINYRKSVDEWSEEIDDAIDEIEIWLETKKGDED